MHQLFCGVVFKLVAHPSLLAPAQATCAGPTEFASFVQNDLLSRLWSVASSSWQNVAGG